MHRNASLADQLAPLAATKAEIIPLPVPRREAQKAAIAAVPVRHKHPRSLRRFWIDLTPQRTNRERTTWRRMKAATPALNVRDFDYYNDALEYSRSIGGEKPIRMSGRAALQWRVVTVNAAPAVAEWVNVGPWQPPFRSYCDDSTIAEVLDAIPDFSEA